jgi:TatA/E family protein of Tat protein translocase
MLGFGSQELFVIFSIGAVLFDANKLSELARSLGRSMAEFRKGMHEGAAGAEKPASSAKPDA